jgi:hypothetical protein
MVLYADDINMLVVDKDENSISNESLRGMVQ